MSQPSTRLKRDRWYHLRYDALSLVVFVAVIVVARFVGWRGPTAAWPFDRAWYWVALPVGIYVHVLASVGVHNATHGSFPKRINRLVAEVCGILIVTRYAAWEIIHRRHHRYADDPERDPHPCQPSFLRYLIKNMTVTLEEQMHAQVYAWHGDNAGVRRWERVRTVLTNVTDTVALVVWYHVLGAPLFFALFLPVQAAGWLIVAHFNWVTHGGSDASGDYRPRNLDSGLYRLGNQLWFGLYFHADHHERPHLFDPRRVSPGR